MRSYLAIVISKKRDNICMYTKVSQSLSLLTWDIWLQLGPVEACLTFPYEPHFRHYSWTMFDEVGPGNQHYQHVLSLSSKAIAEGNKQFLEYTFWENHMKKNTNKCSQLTMKGWLNLSYKYFLDIEIFK